MPHWSRAIRAISPGHTPGTTASGLMTPVISPGRETARDQWLVHVASPPAARGILIGPGPCHGPGLMVDFFSKFFKKFQKKFQKKISIFLDLFELLDSHPHTTPPLITLYT